MTKLSSSNVSDWVRCCEAALESGGAWFGHGTDNALDEAAWLVLHILGKPLDGSFQDWDQGVSAVDGARIEALLEERIKTRQPLAYLLGEAWFCGLRFRVNSDVLVPRSPIGELIPGGFRPWVRPETVHDALDLCTGSGCIAIAMAVYMPAIRVDAVDLSPTAISVATRNVEEHGVADRVRVLESDGFSAVAGRRYDLVVTNPPYVPAGTLTELPREYGAEPEMGLVSGEDGLDLPLRLLRDAPQHLKKNGVLIMEVGESAERLQALLPGVPMTWLEFEHGGEGVFTMERKALEEAQVAIEALMEKRNNVR